MGASIRKSANLGAFTPSNPDYPQAADFGNVRSSLDASRAGPLTLKQRRIKRHTEGAFSCLPFIMAAGVGIPRDGRSLCPVLATRTSPPPRPLTEVADSSAQRSPIMTTSPQGTAPKIRPSAEQLQMALTVCDSVCVLLDQSIRYPASLTPNRLDAIVGNLASIIAELEGRKNG
jgi:hypothetical protein